MGSRKVYEAEAVQGHSGAVSPPAPSPRRRGPGRGGGDSGGSPSRSLRLRPWSNPQCLGGGAHQPTIRRRADSARGEPRARAGGGPRGVDTGGASKGRQGRRQRRTRVGTLDRGGAKAKRPQAQALAEGARHTRLRTLGDSGGARSRRQAGAAVPTARWAISRRRHECRARRRRTPCLRRP